jgi:hypothetical protein
VYPGFRGGGFPSAIPEVICGRSRGSTASFGAPDTPMESEDDPPASCLRHLNSAHPIPPRGSRTPNATMPTRRWISDRPGRLRPGKGRPSAGNSRPNRAF